MSMTFFFLLLRIGSVRLSTRLTPDLVPLLGSSLLLALSKDCAPVDRSPTEKVDDFLDAVLRLT